jgi:hypothetical protein
MNPQAPVQTQLSKGTLIEMRPVAPSQCRCSDGTRGASPDVGPSDSGNKPTARSNLRVAM